MFVACTEPVFSSMVGHLLHPLTADVHFLRLGVSFVSHDRKVDEFIGRAAHISFLDRMPFLWSFFSLYKKYFL